MLPHRAHASKVEKVNPGFAATLKKEIEPLRQRIAKEIAAVKRG
jgi:hypothetical protein